MSAIEKIKIGLDEARMLTLGAQVLVGFQLQAPFQSRFDDLSAAARQALIVGLLLLLSSLGLLIAPGMYHILVERLQATARIRSILTGCQTAALGPLAGALGLNVAISSGLAIGPASALVGAGVASAAAVAWFVCPLALRLRTGRKERAMASITRSESIPVDEQLDHLLTEARTILPGAQALLGFQLAAMLTEPFARLPLELQALHLAALLLLAGSVILLMTPAAIHRIVYRGEETENLVTTGSIIVTCAVAPLGLAMALDVAIVSTRASLSNVAAASVGLGVLTALTAAWLVGPLAARRRRQWRA